MQRLVLHVHPDTPPDYVDFVRLLDDQVAEVRYRTGWMLTPARWLINPEPNPLLDRCDQLDLIVATAQEAAATLPPLDALVLDQFAAIEEDWTRTDPGYTCDEISHVMADMPGVDVDDVARAVATHLVHGRLVTLPSHRRTTRGRHAQVHRISATGLLVHQQRHQEVPAHDHVHV